MGLGESKPITGDDSSTAHQFIKNSAALRSALISGPLNIIHLKLGRFCVTEITTIQYRWELDWLMEEAEFGHENAQKLLLTMAKAALSTIGKTFQKTAAASTAPKASRLGSGTFGEVVLTRIPGLNEGKLVAVKIMPAFVAIPPSGKNVLCQSRCIIDLWLVEAACLTKLLPHPGVPEFFGSMVTGATCYIAMEACKYDLACLIEISPRELPIDTCLTIFTDVSAGLSHIHAAGIIHADLKPTNILVTWEGGAKITDFGSAIIPSENTSDELRFAYENMSCITTKGFVAPECMKELSLNILNGTEEFHNCELYQQLLEILYRQEKEITIHINSPHLSVAQKLQHADTFALGMTLLTLFARSKGLAIPDIISSLMYFLGPLRIRREVSVAAAHAITFFKQNMEENSGGGSPKTPSRPSSQRGGGGGSPNTPSQPNSQRRGGGCYTPEVLARPNNP